MSYSYDRVERRRRTTTGGASYGYTGNRSTFGYWIPLILTATAATIGVVAWVWSERKDDEEDSSEEEHLPGGVPPPGYASMSGGLPPGPGPGGFQGPPQSMGGPPHEGGFQGPPAGMGGPPGRGPPSSQAGFPGPPQSQAGFPGPPQSQAGFAGPPGTGPQPQQAGFPGPPPGQMGNPLTGNSQTGEYARSTSIEQTQVNDTSLVGRFSSALGMSGSNGPAQSYDWASKKVTAGVAAAGAMIGLNSIRESGDGYEDHERWSEEAETKKMDEEPKMGIKRQGTAHEFFSGEVELPKEIALSTRKRKTIAIVVSAVELDTDGVDDVGHHASILSHLPEHVNLELTRVFILIYAPDLKTHPLSPVATRRTSQSMASSFSNISQADIHTPAHTPGEFPNSTDGDNGILSHVDPNPIDDSSSLYKTLHNQANALVERDSMILPFTSKNGHKHILKSLGPEVVYIQESLCGRNGELISDLSGWVRQTVVVVGDEGGYGGLVDTEDEGEEAKETKWWQKEERTGVGRGVAVVESLKVGDDWTIRLGEGG